MMVHSYLYYVLGVSIITDDQWQSWANELVVLQRDHPQPIGFFDDEFSDWTGDTGMHLIKIPWAKAKAWHLFTHHPQFRDTETEAAKLT